ncbi:bifunctional DNA-formamidopyrimidine glycosylase/DNA-(apurinic or apyrimidinic site) lyase [Actinomycetaceae bacterium MB13-C1-2]|nr:bifunctional DNA-formamidopyrimidine glycosylase/DNA-(apurinic or apyrimidinic site) lyase [Actinomycetaceae bacterium MB13-C1-2]
MPELPEVETIRRGLDKHLSGKQIVSVEGAGGRLVRNNPGGMMQLRDSLTGAQIESVERRGKFMWMLLDGAAESSLVIHLGMSGQVRTATHPPAELDRHEHVRLTFSDGMAARFVDPRMFGHLTLSELVQDQYGRRIPEITGHIAPDLLELRDRSSLLELAERMHTRNRAIKTMLLDQGLVSGVGNIYADEGLFRAGVQGRSTGASLSIQQLSSLLERTREVMTQAVAAGGTSFDTLYVDADGNPGYFERELKVYGREDQECLVCGGPIARETIGGRSHFHCATCQRVVVSKT